MIKRNLLSVGVAGIFIFLATGSTPEIMEQIQGAGGGGGGGGNKAACESYVNNYNELPCMKKAGVTLNAGDMCPESLDATPVDMTAYYKCLEDGSKCNGDIPDLEGAASCTP